MLEKKISTKQEMMRLLQATSVSRVLAKDIHKPDDLNEIKKEGLKMLQERKMFTAFLVVT